MALLLTERCARRIHFTFSSFVCKQARLSFYFLYYWNNDVHRFYRGSRDQQVTVIWESWPAARGFEPRPSCWDGAMLTTWASFVHCEKRCSFGLHFFAFPFQLSNRNGYENPPTLIWGYWRQYLCRHQIFGLRIWGWYCAPEWSLLATMSLGVGYWVTEFCLWNRHWIWLGWSFRDMLRMSADPLLRHIVRVGRWHKLSSSWCDASVQKLQPVVCPKWMKLTYRIKVHEFPERNGWLSRTK